MIIMTAASRHWNFLTKIISRLTLFSFFKDFIIYLKQRKRAITSRGSAGGKGESKFGAEQGARHRAKSQELEIMTRAEGRHPKDWATQVPLGWLHIHHFSSTTQNVTNHDKRVNWGISFWMSYIQSKSLKIGFKQYNWGKIFNKC